MCSNEFGGKRGVTIIPSARKSIHSHHSCPFSNDHKMVRYGLNKQIKNPSTNISAQQKGRDEVDNAMSKLALPINNLNNFLSRQNPTRRNSFDGEQASHQYKVDEVSDVLSKSLPTYLPSRSYYSDDDDDDDELSSIIKDVHSDNSDESANFLPTIPCASENENISFNSHNSYTRPYYVRDSSVLENRTSHRHKTPTPAPVVIKTSKRSSGLIMFWSIIIIAVGILATVYGNLTSKSINKSHFVYDHNKFYMDMMNLVNTYNVHMDVVEQVSIGISSIFENSDADSFVFIYNSQSDNLDEDSFNSFMDDIAYIAAKYLRNESASVQHTVIDGRSLNLRDSGELVDKYRDEMIRSGVMLVKNIDAVPPTLAMAFHCYCDEYNPIAKRSAVFSTLNLLDCTQTTGMKSLYATIEKCLSTKWEGGVPPANMAPLLTRVVSVVVDVAGAFNERS